MISWVLAAVLLVSANGAGSNPAAPAASPEAERPNAERRIAEIAILSAEEEAAQMERKSPLIERLIRSARSAFEEGRYEDATGLARRARISASQRGREAPRVTRPVGPTIESLFEALERLQAAENRRISSPLLATARELIAASEAAVVEGQLTQADALAKRAILMLAALPSAPADASSETGTVRIDLNRASPSELRRLPGLTESMIRNLVWFRTNIGPFRSVAEIRYVPEFSSEYIPIAEYFLEVEPMGAAR